MVHHFFPLYPFLTFCFGLGGTPAIPSIFLFSSIVCLKSSFNFINGFSSGVVELWGIFEGFGSPRSFFTDGFLKTEEKKEENVSYGGRNIFNRKK